MQQYAAGAPEVKQPPLLLAIIVIALAALGGAFAVFGGYDDSPGATLIGMLVVLGAMVANVRAARRSA